MTFDPSALERFAKDVAPELRAVPVYFVNANEIPGMRDADAFLGVVLGVADVTFQEHLSPWRGRGPCITLNPRGIREEAIAYADAIDWPLAKAVDHLTHSVVLHELGHVLNKPAPWYDPIHPDDPCPTPPLSMLREVLLQPSAETRPAGIAPYWGHEWPWIRIVLHLRHRAERLGYRFSAANLINHQTLDIHHPDRYRAELGREPERMAGQTFTAIMATPPPAGFLTTWQSDEKNWSNEEHERTTRENHGQLQTSPAGT